MRETFIYQPNHLFYTQEPLLGYKPGGYHPVTLGDSFKDGRYQVHHKLGWGKYSTTWLAYDKSNGYWVSLEIVTANADDSSRSRELHHLQLLEGRCKGFLSSKYVIQFLDIFSHNGPNGDHQCLVFELLGPPVEWVLMDYSACADHPEYTDPGDKLEPGTIMRMSRQLLECVEFIHSAGMAHGDISGWTVVFSGKSLSTIRERIFKFVGVPEVEPLVRSDGRALDEGLPTHLVKAIVWDSWVEEDHEDLRIIDFGRSFFQWEKNGKAAKPGLLPAPETIFTGSFDYRVDLWRAGCVIYSFVFGASPFTYKGDNNALVAQMIGLVGTNNMPEDWKAQYSVGHGLDRKRNTQLSELKRRLVEHVNIPDLAPLVSVIEGLMRLVPSSRITASTGLSLLGPKKRVSN
ncbi:uncharacterized protein ASPGLDRAFT_151795 [Aspergillus glaucus CBS 516.65]|uniref:Protein kinase domain-containing protein n=1 Tax=Aspergillus glaucus CBS 516.65 TaxID=1160497 RepID=A0A1L9VGU7_ASPGL|nr:hypothetical protein ASPGLDRAFT_151795 [Aspergillus glaucus CBS 516.65]OJJ83134.1 hypothetical protein ASPGLDRAFT_151795 [Aspergillus glaucus CBS 516.65]